MSHHSLIDKAFYALALFVSALMIFIPTLSQAGNAQDEELVFFNWSDYVDPELIHKFEQQYHVKVNQAFFDSDDNRSDVLVETDTVGYDVVIVDSQNMDSYRKAGWLEKIDTSKTPNYRHIDPRLLNEVGDNSEYTVPYFWGTLGIAYRKDLVPTPPKTWMDLFRPAKELHGAIAMYRNTVDLIPAALKALGYSANDTTSEALEQVEQLLIEQKPYVLTYDYLSLNEDSALVSGDIKSAMFYSSDALMVKEFDDNITYIIPSEGTMIWIDHLVVMKSSKHKELAWQFINFLNEPVNAAQLAEWVHGATPNTAAAKLLPEEILQDTVIYPDIKILEKSEVNQPLPARIIKKRNRIVEETIN